EPSLRIRTGPSLTERQIGSIPLGAQVIVWHGSDQSGFVKLVDKEGWVSAQYLSATDPAATASTTTGTSSGTPTRSKNTRIGLHIATNPDVHRLVGMAKRLFDAGKPFGVVTVISSPEVANALAPYTTVMFRMVWDNRERYSE